MMKSLMQFIVGTKLYIEIITTTPGRLCISSPLFLYKMAEAEPDRPEFECIIMHF